MKKRFILFVVTSLLLALSTSSFAAMPAADPVKVGLSKDLIYFIFPDRYLNGDTSNDSFPGTTQETPHFFMEEI